ncbi:ribonuclease H-like domain-containing protein, partial [Tanacetum coccineum]
MFYSRDVKFYETIFPYKMSLEKDKCLVKDESELKVFSENDDLTSHKTFFDDFQTDSQASSLNDDGGEPSSSNIGSESESDDTAWEQSFDDDQGSMQIGEEDLSEGNVCKKFDVPTNLKVRYGLDKFANHTWLSVENCGFIANINMSFEPKSYKEAVLDKNWVQAMNDEIEALHENNSWDLVELPKNRKATGSKWVYKIKHTSTGEIDRYKDRLVAKGFNQREGIDYEETFSLVVKMGTVRCLISLAIQKGWCLFQLDVNNAFLYGNLDEDVYMLPPPGYFDKNETKVCKLKRVDMVILYIQKNSMVLKTEKGGLCLSQRKYCLELLHNYGLLACKPVLTPLPENIILAHKESEDDKFLINITSYQRLVGKLIYLTLTRPDISYFVHCLSQHMQAPLQSHMDLGLRVLRYLNGAPGSGVNYEKSEHMSLKVYADSDSAKCPVTRRSVSGYCVFFNGCMVTWKSKKQATLSKSYAEAEYRSMAAATCELMWVVNILKDLKVTNFLPAELFCDNSAAIQIAANPVIR